MTRQPEAVKGMVGPGTEVVYGDVLQRESLLSACEGVDVAFYFIHSMGAQADFADQDLQGAENFARAAQGAGVRRIIYLGGLGDAEDSLSKHLRSRQQTGAVLRASKVPVIELRASIVIGSGSLSFEMIRALVERLPVMICPKWVHVKAQPIAIEDVLRYLLESIELPEGPSKVYEIGGPDVVSYGEIMNEYARQRGLRRLMIPVPLLTPYLSSLWLGLVTPVYARVGRKMIDSMRNPTLVQDESARSAFSVAPMAMREAIRRALRNEDQQFASTRWSDALSVAGYEQRWGGVRFGSRLVDSRTIHCKATPEEAFAAVERVGGDTGWYYGNRLWRLRGFLDLLIGGVGVRRGRRDPEHLRVGDVVDFWRVDALEAGRLLRLRAEMKVPGRAWLEFEVTPGVQGSQIRQTAIFDPIGLWGLFYWYSLYPAHQLIFSRMLRNLASAAEDASGGRRQ
ncbi:MAG: NAD-dependent epimerase [Pirellulaceae bacterium]|nr:MAG: NAD-dependent epimerase [Pirellulaceae bacterium]